MTSYNEMFEEFLDAVTNNKSEKWIDYFRRENVQMLKCSYCSSTKDLYPTDAEPVCSDCARDEEFDG